jgi:hypothetical protein
MSTASQPLLVRQIGFNRTSRDFDCKRLDVKVKETDAIEIAFVNQWGQPIGFAILGDEELNKCVF